MKLIAKTGFILLSLGLTVIPGLAQHASIQKTVDKQVISRLEQTIPRLMADGDIPGLSIALVRKGEVVWSRGFGVKNVETKEAVDDNTVFEAASLTKPVFSYAIMKLVDSGKIDLDTPLTKYLPGTYDVGDDPRLNEVTARRVLSHTTGFPNWRPRGDKTLKIYFTPGDRFSYSGEGFVYLARVVEHITGESLDVYMKKAVLDPLDMKNSSFIWINNYETLKAFSHNPFGTVSGRNKPEKANAAASLHTTANDYARFVVAILKGTGLKPATARMMLTPQVSVAEAGFQSLNQPNPKLSTTIYWGLGWGLEKTDDGMAFWHWGDNGDTKAYVAAFEKQRSGLVMFANSATGLSILPELVAEALGGQHPSLTWVNIERYNSAPRQLLKAILKSDAETALSDYRKRRETKVQSPTSNVQSPMSKDQVGDASEKGNGKTGPSTPIAASKSKDQSTKYKNAQSNENQLLTENEMNRLGYELLRVKRIKDAIEVFKQNTVDFPNEFNTWDSLAEGYMVNGDKDLAIKYYKKSLELNPNNTNAVQKLKELGG